MIIWKTGDIFNSTCKTLVNTVNCEGVMGKGLAKIFKEKYKGTMMFECYQYACKYGIHDHGGIHEHLLNEGGDIYFWYFTKANVDPQWLPFEQQFDNLMNIKNEEAPAHHILHFATKKFWRNPSKLEWIERGLYNFCQRDYEFNGQKFKYYNLGPDTWIKGMSTIAWPKLGCTNGGLNWEKDVKPLMIKYLQPLDIVCEIYE